MTLQEFNKGFKPFLDFFPTESMTKEKINIYFAALSDLSLKQLNISFERLVKNRVWKSFPQPAEIRQYALGKTETDMNVRINLAKEKLKLAILKYGAYGSIEFDDKGIHAAIDSLGGWQEVCKMLVDDFDKFLTFEFPKIYKAYWEMPYNINPYYLGITDNSNNTKNIKFIGNSNMGIGNGNLIENNQKMLIRG